MLVSYKCNIATEKAVAFLVVILYLVGGLGGNIPPRDTVYKRCINIYIIVLLPRRRAVHSRHRTKVNPHPTNQQGLLRRKGKPRGRRPSGGFLPTAKNGGVGVCRRTASTRGGITCNGRTKADRHGEGPTWPNPTPPRREARTPDTGQGQNTAGGGQGGRGA